MRFLLLLIFLLAPSAIHAESFSQLGGFVHKQDSTVSATATKTLVVGDNQIQILTGSQNHTFTMPDAQVLVNGWWYTFINLSSGTAQINDGGGSSIVSLLQDEGVRIYLTDNATVAGVWAQVKSAFASSIITDHGGLLGLGDDDHSAVYFNTARGDAQYFKRTRFRDESIGAADGGEPVKLNGVGDIDVTMLPPIAHGDLTSASLLLDQHPQYHTDVRGDIRYFQKSEFLDSGPTAAGVPVKTNSLGVLDATLFPTNVGQNNTASNIGTAGVGVFDGKVGFDLQFRNINAGSSKITITDDSANDEIDIDAVEANFDLANLGGSLDLTSQVTGALPIGNGGGNPTTLGTASQELRVNAGATALEFFTTVAAVGGADTEVQYNNSGALDGESNFKFFNTGDGVVIEPDSPSNTFDPVVDMGDGFLHINGQNGGPGAPGAGGGLIITNSTDSGTDACGGAGTIRALFMNARGGGNETIIQGCNNSGFSITGTNTAGTTTLGNLLLNDDSLGLAGITTNGWFRIQAEQGGTDPAAPSTGSTIFHRSSDDELYARTDDGVVSKITNQVAGSDTEIQFNDGGEFGSEAAFTYTKGTNTAVIDTITLSGTIDGRDPSVDGTKLDGIATGAEVNPAVISQADAEAGTATDERIWTAQRVAQAIAALETASGGGDHDATVCGTGCDYTSINTALANVATGSSIILKGIATENVVVFYEGMQIVGLGRGSWIDGSVTIQDPADYTRLTNLRVTNTITVEDGNKATFIDHVWSDQTTDAGAIVIESNATDTVATPIIREN